MHAPWILGFCLVRDIDSDLQAVAFCAALLTAFGAPAHLVRRFVTAFDPLACAMALDAILPLVSSEKTTTETLPNMHPHPKTSTLLLDFSSSASLTSAGVSAILVAALVLPKRVYVELDLRLCPRLTALSLERREWQLFLDGRVTDHPSTPCSHVVGLALDACPLRSIHSSVLSRMMHLQWISLRATHIRSLFRAGEIVHNLSSLRRVLFSGSCVDDTLFDNLRCCNASDIKETDNLTVSQFPSGEHFDRWKSFPSNRHRVPTCMTFSVVPFCLRLAEMRKLVHSGPFILDSVGHAEFNLNYQDLFPSFTPASKSRHFRKFMIAAACPNLDWIDGQVVDSLEIENARKYIDAHFEGCTFNSTDACVPSALNSSSVLNLLRVRELGLSNHPSVPDQRRGSGSKGHRPLKRKRTTVWSSRQSAPNVSAALDAAGLSLSRNSNLSPSDSVILALTAISSRQNSPESKSTEHMRRIEQAMLNEFDAYTQPKSICNHNQHPIGRTSKSHFREGSFERIVGSALITRFGTPKLEYFVQHIDFPTQFEYNPGKPAELVYGTALGYLVVMDEETGLVRGCCSVGGGAGYRSPGDFIQRQSRLNHYGQRGWGNISDGNPIVNGQDLRPRERLEVFGISWLNQRTDLFLSGTHEEGRIHLYNVDWMSNGKNGGCVQVCDSFEKLTSIHSNADDRAFAVSGLSPHVGLFDMGTGKRLEMMRHCHSDSINVIKFANHNPNVLITSSFDRFVRKWDLRERRPNGARRPIFSTVSPSDNIAVSFSPDDERLLVSALDNDVRQYCAYDGRLLFKFDMPQTGSDFNFTRSYYMNGGNYVVSGSCNESVVRVYNARNGKCVTEVDMDERFVPPGSSLCVQTLRGNPLRPYSFCALLFSKDRPLHKMMASVDLRSRW